MKPTLISKCLCLAVIGLAQLAVAEARAADQQYFELRTYTTKSEHQQTLVADYWHNAAVPAYHRMGVGPVGVFSEVEASPTNHIYVLIPYDSLEAFNSVHAHLAADAEYQKAAADFLNVPKSDPAYARFESTLSVAFESMKKLAVPEPPAEGKSRIFELRTYQSPSESKGDNKVLMFNNGEVPLMKEVGLAPVFFGQAITGSQMPNLVYMVSGENKEEHAKHWKAFFDAPVWKKLSGDSQYKDNVSKVINVFLKRLPGSEI